MENRAVGVAPSELKFVNEIKDKSVKNTLFVDCDTDTTKKCDEGNELSFAITIEFTEFVNEAPTVKLTSPVGFMLIILEHDCDDPSENNKELKFPDI